MANILNGKEVGASIEINLKSEIDKLKTSGIIPKLAIMRIGENPGDMAYENAAVAENSESGIRQRMNSE